MVSVSLESRDILGLIPALDNRKIEQARVMDGVNFTWDADGPYSGFGSSLLHEDGFTNPDFIETFRANDTVYFCTTGGIFIFDPVKRMYIPQILFTATTSKTPWSHAHVGSLHFFCHKDVGIITFNPAIESWETYADASLPATPVYITNSRGRLVILGLVDVAWSALDDGEDITPSTVTGAGAQAISIIGGTAYAVLPLSDGFLTYTSEGIMKSTYIGGGVTYRHRTVTRKVNAISGFAVAELDENEHAFMDRKGLYSISGNTFKPLEPLMNDYLFNNLFRAIDVESSTPNIRLHYNNLDQHLFVSISTSDASNQFNYAFVYNTAVGKWGQFNYLHHAFLVIDTDLSSNSGIKFAFMGSDAKLRLLDRQHYEEVETSRAFAELYNPLAEFPSRKIEGKWTMASLMYMTAWDEAPIEDAGFTAGLYTNLEDLPVKKLDRSYVGLDAHVQVGLFQYSEQTTPDQFGFIEAVSIGAGYTPVGQIEEDWLILSGFEDWNVDAGEEDWGENIPSEENFTVDLETFFDGITVETTEPLAEHTDIGAQKFYYSDSSGMFFGLRIKAETVGHVFHLKFLEISGTVLGRI